MSLAEMSYEQLEARVGYVTLQQYLEWKCVRAEARMARGSLKRKAA
jgi:hypothetical protein